MLILPAARFGINSDNLARLRKYARDRFSSHHRRDIRHSRRVYRRNSQCPQSKLTLRPDPWSVVGYDLVRHGREESSEQQREMASEAMAGHDQRRVRWNNSRPRPYQGRYAPVRGEHGPHQHGSRTAKYSIDRIDVHAGTNRLKQGNLGIRVDDRLPRRRRQLPVVAVKRDQLIARKSLYADPVDVFR